MKTPILFLIFNRPELTAQVFSTIRQVQPAQLFIAADGPRANRAGEKEKCEMCRAIVSKIDWPCEVQTLFREQNLGCKKAVSGAIDWFFDNVEEGIILEDDCLPDPSFFKYCSVLLEYYRDNPKVMHIAGVNFLSSTIQLPESYFFSKLFYIWGWATWKRAWKFYDVGIADWPTFQKKLFISNQLPHKMYRYYQKNWNKIYANQIDTWDYQWSFACLKQHAVGIVPTKNMVKNIGFDADATHTIFLDDRCSNLKIHSMEFPLNHPLWSKSNSKYDEQAFKIFAPRFTQRLQSKLHEILHSKFRSLTPSANKGQISSPDSLNMDKIRS